ncbi:MAG TPA: copper chaperone PCu(A)C [Caldilineaceae bacterium]|nr:copper chaperone PCu(A)C [Caldilineaceae bacterium]
MFSIKTRSSIVGLLLSASLIMIATACNGSDAENVNDGLQIMVMAPSEGMDAETLVVAVLDADGQPVTDAQVGVEGNMNHAGMVPVMADPVTDDADGAADGHYQLPFAFSMLGDWILTVTVSQADGSTVTKDIEVTVSDEGISGDGAVMDHETMDHSAMDHSNMEQGDMAEGLTVENVMARAVPVAGTNGAVYLTIHNGTAMDDQLVSVTSDVAEAAELHETINDNNVMRMEARPEGFAIPAGESIELTPGGKHIMLVGVSSVLEEGSTFTVTLTFAHADPQTVEVPVMAMDAVMDHSNMGD